MFVSFFSPVQAARRDYEKEQQAKEAAKPPPPPPPPVRKDADVQTYYSENAAVQISLGNDFAAQTSPRALVTEETQADMVTDSGTLLGIAFMDTKLVRKPGIIVCTHHAPLEYRLVCLCNIRLLYSKMYTTSAFMPSAFTPHNIVPTSSVVPTHT